MLFVDILKKEEDFVCERSSNFFNRCRRRLVPYPVIQSSLEKSYDVSDFIPELKNVLLSRRGVNIAENGEIGGLWVCRSCYDSLNNGKDKDEKFPPKFSIANGFSIGDLPPHLRDVTITERKLTSLASFRGHTVIGKGGRHKFIQSHILVFSSQPDKIEEGIDKVMDNENKILLIIQQTQ